MKFITLAFLILLVGYAMTHRPERSRPATEARSQTTRSRTYRNRSLESLQEECAARERMLREMKHTIATGNVPKCSSATSVTFAPETYATLRRLENELEVLRTEIRARTE